MTPAEQRLAFVAAARGLVGARWRHRGRKPWALDCVGLIVMAAERAGFDVQDERLYGREPWDDRLRTECQRRWGSALPVTAAAPGDVLVIRWANTEPSHVGIVGDHPQGGISVIHAHNLHGVVEQRLDARIARMVVGVYRLIQVPNP